MQQINIPGNSWYGDVASIAAFAYAIGFTLDSFPTAIILSIILEIMVAAVRGEIAGWNFFIVITATALGATEFFECKLHSRMGRRTESSSRRKSADREFFLIVVLLAAQYVCCRLVARDSTISEFPCGLFISEAIFSVFALCELVIMELTSPTRNDARMRTYLWLCLCIGMTFVHSLGFLATSIHGIGPRIIASGIACISVPVITCIIYVLFFRSSNLF